MASRPPNWAPLAADDPVPGRPDDIRNEAARQKGVADSIHDQVTALTRVAQGDPKDLNGQYSKKMTDTAKSLADHLGRAQQRYRVVSGELLAWADDLELAQRDSANQLTAAQQAQRDIDTNTPHPAPNTPAPAQSSTSTPDPHQQHLLAQAQQALGDAQAALARTVSQLQDKAKHHAAEIRNVIKHDGMKDSHWDKFKHWVDDNKHWLSDVCNGLGWLATACAVVALFIPGVNVVALTVLTAVAIGSTGFSLLGHSMLAAAGDGSWFDVGVDAFALVTFGFGRAAGTAAKEGEAAVKTTLGGAGTRALNKAVAADSDLQKAYQVVDSTDGSISAAEKAAAWSEIASRFGDADAAAQGARDAAQRLGSHAVPKAPKFEWPKRTTWWNGDREIGVKRPWVQDIGKTLADDKVAQHAANLDKTLRSVGNWWRVGTGVDVFDKAFGSVAPWHTFHSPVSGGWQDYSNVTRNPFTMPIGSTW